MKYGIMTYHGIPNFGAILQGFALCSYIRSIDADCEIINYHCENIENREIRYHKSNNCIKNIIKRTVIWPKQKKKIEECIQFLNSVYSKNVYTKDNISEANKEYDGFIAGSDMIWNLEVNGNDFSYFLNFVDDDKLKIAYAASVGKKWSKDDIYRVKEFLTRFDAIGVREQDTNLQINKELSIDSVCVPDPTILIKKDEWKKYIYDIDL